MSFIMNKEGSIEKYLEKENYPVFAYAHAITPPPHQLLKFSDLKQLDN